MKTYLIDDDQLAVYLTEQLLRAEDFSNSIHTFGSAREALNTLLGEGQEAAPQVVFLDLNMPLMNGWQFLDALHPYKAHLLGRCFIYILTSSLALADLEKSRQYDLVAGLIHKPIDSGEIRAIQSRLLPGPGPAALWA
ncbi:response regulator [Hymenobacter rubripertinctus]|nr:response regulator [Hymenobacter rubripertinctus]